MGQATAIPTERMGLGALWVVLSYAFLVCMNATAKVLQARLPPYEVVFFQSLFMTLIYLPWVLSGGVKEIIPNKGSWGLHLLRDITGILAYLCSLCSVKLTCLGDTFLLNSASAFWVPLILWVFLGQKISSRLWLCILLGFAGVLFVLRPSGAIFNLGSIFGLFSGIFIAIALVTLRQLTEREPMKRIIFYFGFISTLTVAPLLLFGWVTPSWIELALMFGLALLMAGAQYMLTLAYSLAPASRLSLFAYCSIAFGVILDWVVWETLPAWSSLVGTALIFGAAVLSLRRNVA